MLSTINLFGTRNIAPDISQPPVGNVFNRNGQDGGANVRPSSGVSGPETVTLSAGVEQAIASGTPMPVNGFNKYFPSREGFSSVDLSNAVTEPGKDTNSAGMSLGEAAKDARVRMDVNYAAMAASGKPFDPNSNEGQDTYALFGNLDRRSLHAVSSNVGGLFSQEEQDMARSIMSQQQGLAMGAYAGPTRLAGDYAFGDSPVRMNDYAGAGKAAVSFLDGVSADEKASVGWAMGRASAQRLYDSGMEMNGLAPENLDSDIPLVKLIRAAMATMESDAGRGMTTGFVRTADDLKAQPWFKGFESRLDALLSAETPLG